MSKNNRDAIIVYRHPIYTWYTIYTYDNNRFYLDLGQIITHSYNDLSSAIQALNYQII